MLGSRKNTSRVWYPGSHMDSLGVSVGLMESIVLNVNHITLTAGETKEEPADMYARIVVQISMTFQALFSIRAKYLLM